MVQVHPAFVCFCLRMKELHSHTVGAVTMCVHGLPKGVICAGEKTARLHRVYEASAATRRAASSAVDTPTPPKIAEITRPKRYLLKVCVVLGE